VAWRLRDELGNDRQAVLQVKIAEGSLYPTRTAVGDVTNNYGGSSSSLAAPESLAALVGSRFRSTRVAPRMQLPGKRRKVWDSRGSISR
jgi:hypothetical protein